MADKSSSDSLGCGCAFIAFLFLFFYFFSSGPIAPGLAFLKTLLKAIAGAAVIGGIAHLARQLFKTDQQLIADIEARKQEALDNNIFILASRVLVQWGKAAEGELHFEDDQMEISSIASKDKSSKMTIVVNGMPVFECFANVEKGIVYDEPIERFERVGDDFELVRKYGTSDRAVIKIEGYIPGRWVKRLQRLNQRAEAERTQKQKAKEAQLAKDKAQAERHKFGL